MASDNFAALLILIFSATLSPLEHSAQCSAPLALALRQHLAATGEADRRTPLAIENQAGQFHQITSASGHIERATASASHWSSIRIIENGGRPGSRIFQQRLVIAHPALAGDGLGSRLL